MQDFSKRECDVIPQLLEGLSNKEIARKLDIFEVTVKFHLRNISEKLGARNRTHAAVLLAKSGWGEQCQITE